MARSKARFLSVVILSFLIFGCSQESDITHPTDENAVEHQSGNLDDKARDILLVSANLSVYTETFNEQPVTIHSITSPWDEMVVTWENFGGAFSPSVSGTFTPDAVGWETADVTTLVQAWLDDPSTDFGLLLDQDSALFPRSRYTSREGAANHPYLEVVYATAFGNQTVVLADIADAYIWELEPTLNTGSRVVIYTARSNTDDLEKQSLLKFDMSVLSQPGALGDWVWLDENEDGIQDDTEMGISGVTVNLLDCAGNLLASTVTNTDGYYLFDNLPAGDYLVGFVVPEGYEVSPLNVGSDDEIDSDADPATGMTACVTLAEGEINLSLDAGLFIPFEEDCGECDGKVSQLTLRYDGTDPTFLQIYDDRDQKPERLMFEGNVNPGDEITVNGTHNGGAMHAEISLWENGTRIHKIHTSCSQPIGPGMTFGDYYIVEGYSRHGGLLCPVEDPGPGDCGECEGKVSELTMRYDGPEATFLQVYDDKNQKPERLMFEGTVSPGDEFTVTGTRRHGEMHAEISLWEEGTRIQKIHTSCSRPIGPGMIFGDYFIVEGYSRHGGLLCPVENPEPGDDWCEVGKARALTILYTGEDCSATTHNQESDKVQCEGDPAFMGTVHIVAMDKENPDDNHAKIWFDGEVVLDTTFELDAFNAGERKLKARTYVFVYDLDGNLLQFVEFHTSCSQTLAEDDQFGSLRLVGFTPEN